MKILVTILIAIISTSSFGILINMSEEAKKECMEDFGGYLPDTRKQKGDLAIINTQNRAHDAWIRFGGNLFANDILIPVKYECGKFDIKSPELKGTLNLFIIDDKTMPLSLLAPEAKWAVLNIEKLYSDKTAFFEARVKKAVYRVIGELCGASATKYIILTAFPIDAKTKKCGRLIRTKRLAPKGSGVRRKNGGRPRVGVS